MTTFTWRPATIDDAPQLFQLMQAVTAADRLPIPTLAGVAQLLARFGEQLANHSRLAATETGSIVALGLILVPNSNKSDVALATIAVHPDFRGRTIGDELLRWQETAVSHLAPLTIRMSCADHLTEQIALFQQNGYQIARYQFKMGRNLAEQLAKRPFPPPLVCEPWHEQHEPALVTAFNEAFAEHWGVQTMTLPLWKEGFTTAVPYFRGDLSFVVHDGSHIIGFAINWILPQQNTGWIEAIGVRPTWRGQGIAAALMVQSLNAFIDADLPQAMLDVDTQNPSGALRLYEKLGFVAQSRTAVFTKSLPAPAPASETPTAGKNHETHLHPRRQS